MSTVEERPHPTFLHGGVTPENENTHASGATVDHPELALAGDVWLAGPIGLTLAWHSWIADIMTGTKLALAYASFMTAAMGTTKRATRQCR